MATRLAHLPRWILIIAAIVLSVSGCIAYAEVARAVQGEQLHEIRMSFSGLSRVEVRERLSSMRLKPVIFDGWPTHMYQNGPWLGSGDAEIELPLLTHADRGGICSIGTVVIILFHDDKVYRANQREITYSCL